MSPEEEKRRRRAKMVAEGSLAGHTQLMEDVVDRIPNDALSFSRIRRLTGR